ncbi:STM4013/SEN3800 family hydrolase [Streptomyces sp. SID3343]|uniref:STM4013/SEN3800 family hydrolase n=1 Tax=Streptomyces sp. SID3343 TaxID=2690260 RepID=UPI0031F8EA03
MAPQVIDAHDVVGHRNILLVTLDSLRYDSARTAWEQGRTPNLAALLPTTGWEERHAAGTFTWPAHQAIFAGFFPKPAAPGRPAGRLFECRPPQGKEIRPTTYVIDDANLVTGLADLGYRTVCIGGVDYFAHRTPLGSVFPQMFTEAHWRPEFGSTHRDSTAHQIAQALDVLDARATHGRKLFMFLNVSATHVPHHHHLLGSDGHDSVESQVAALADADTHLGKLIDRLPDAGGWLVVICADHGDAYGDDGFHGHGIAHPSVLTVPYTEILVG